MYIIYMCIYNFVYIYIYINIYIYNYVTPNLDKVKSREMSIFLKVY